MVGSRGRGASRETELLETALSTRAEAVELPAAGHPCGEVLGQAAFTQVQRAPVQLQREKEKL